jgi:hypothetical protein
MLFSLTFPDWLTNEKYLAPATWGLVGATLLLVLATIILFLDSFFKGREQRRRWEREDVSRAKEQQARWEREDRIREEDAKPKVSVEIGKRENAPEIVFKCFNLGNTIFIIDQMIIIATNPKCGFETRDLVGPPVLFPGKFATMPYDCKYLLTDGFQEANAVFVLRGPHGLERTQPVWFYVSPDPTRGYDWTIGRLADRLEGAIVPQPRSIPKGR